MLNNRAKNNFERGYSLVELLVVITMISIIMSIALFDYRSLQDPVEHGAQQLTAFFRKTRAKALASTRAYFISPSTSQLVVTSYGTSCQDASPLVDGTLELELPSGAFMTDTDWSFCYSTRGFSDTSVDIIVSDGAESKTVEVVLGGAARVL